MNPSLLSNYSLLVTEFSQALDLDQDAEFYVTFLHEILRRAVSILPPV